MKPTKPHLATSEIDARTAAEREERQVALEYLADAWNEAEDDGLSPVALAHASLFAAFASLVEHCGEEAAVELARALPDQILAGDYSLTRTIQ